MKMQCVLEDRTVVEKDCKLVFVIGEGDVNQVKSSNSSGCISSVLLRLTLLEIKSTTLKLHNQVM